MISVMAKPHLTDEDYSDLAGLLPAIFILIIAGSALVGCGVKVSQSLADRCADIMQGAMPFAEIDIDKRASESTSLSTIVARVEGTRTDLPEGSPPHDLAAEMQIR